MSEFKFKLKKMHKYQNRNKLGGDREGNGGGVED